MKKFIAVALLATGLLSTPGARASQIGEIGTSFALNSYNFGIQRNDIDSAYGAAYAYIYGYYANLFDREASIQYNYAISSYNSYTFTGDPYYYDDYLYYLDVSDSYSYTALEYYSYAADFALDAYYDADSATNPFGEAYAYYAFIYLDYASY